MQTFKQNIINIYGNQGKNWLAGLPALTAELARKYQLTDLQPVDNMSFNYVATGFQHKNPIILKLGLNKKALAKEADCLQAFAGQGVVKRLASESGMILMQRAVPGTALKEYFPAGDQQAVSILCECIQQLHTADIPQQHHYYHLTEVLSVLDNDLDIPQDILFKARQLRDVLLSSSEKTVLLHGDLHHDNIVKHDESWLVIDPKGFIGDPVFEVCAFIHNPLPEVLEQANPTERINERIQACADQLGFSKQRIQDWLYVKSVLCWAWCLDDNMSEDYFKRFVSLLDESD